MLRCEVEATLKLRCQRCLERLDYQVDANVLSAFVSGIDEERRLPQRYDPLLVSDIPIRPADLIEDELLLALPQIPMHERDLCAMHVEDVAAAPERPGGASPFAVLAEFGRKE